MRKYGIVNVSDVDSDMEANSVDGAVANWRQSLSGTDRAVLRWEDTKHNPDLTNVTVYSHADILTELKGSDWTSLDHGIPEELLTDQIRSLLGI